MYMKFAKFFIMFALMAAPVYAAECSQSQALNDLLNGTKTICDPAESVQKAEALKDKADMYRELNKHHTPLWTDKQIDEMAKEAAKNAPLEPNIIFVYPLR